MAMWLPHLPPGSASPFAWFGDSYRLEASAGWIELAREAVRKLWRVPVRSSDYSYMEADRTCK